MKRTLYIISIAILCAVACKNVEPVVPVGVDLSEFPEVVPNEGGEFDIELASSGAWTAVTDAPWVSVTPANGPSSTVCTIRVDSTVLDQSRSTIVRFQSRATGTSCDVKVLQDGYGYSIVLPNQEINLNHYANAEDRKFEVLVHTNVPFDVVIPESASKWLSCERPEFNLDRGARPRDVKVKFEWGVNSVPVDRNVVVSFVPQAGWNVVAADVLKVNQAAAPEIKVGHDGDSIAVQSLARNLGLLQPMITSEPMANWDNVILWEEGDEGYTPEKKGRVRYARFDLFHTTETIPYEVQYLTEAEELVFFSNVNSFRFNLDLGEHICKLVNLKRLIVSAYGISSLPQDFTNLRNLEWLDLSCNNFSTVPSVLTPENFPKLHALLLNTCQRHYILDLSNAVEKDLAGFKGEFPRRLLEWENLDTLRLSVNFFEGVMPDMLDSDVKYTADDCTRMNLPSELIGTPKVLPNAKFFAFNLNRMYGRLPDWVLYHPNLTMWEPYVLCYPQEGRASNGTAASFTNVPSNMDYYWSFYKGYKEHVDIYLGD